MNKQRKFEFVVNSIYSAYEFSPDKNFVRLDISDLLDDLSENEIDFIIHELQNKYNVIKVIAKPNMQNTLSVLSRSRTLLPVGLFYDLEMNKKFETWYESQNYATNETKTTEKLNTNIVYKITYTTNREIVLNDYFIISKPTFNGENDLVFNYLYNHPFKISTVKQIEQAIGSKLTKDLPKIVEKLNFQHDLLKVFFTVSKTAVEFRNPITPTELEKVGITKIRLIGK